MFLCTDFKCIFLCTAFKCMVLDTKKVLFLHYLFLDHWEFDLIYF